MAMLKSLKLLTVTHVTHYRHEGKLFGYAPYVREMDALADLFCELSIAAPCRDEPPPDDCCAFTRTNITLRRQPETGGKTWIAKLRQAALVPQHIWMLSRAMWNADAIHVRCPGNLGLLGILLAPIFSRRLIGKYTGPWSGFPEEPLTWTLQRRLFRSFWWRGPVTVYGDLPGMPSHVIPFFTSIMSEEQLACARQAAKNKQFGDPLRVLFVGRLTEEKNVDVLLRAIASLKSEQIPLRCSIVGEGPYQERLQQLTGELGLTASEVTFAGAVEFEQVLEAYKEGDVLVLASLGDSWGKVVTEAMSFGLICIGSNRDMVAQNLADGRGFAVPARDLPALCDALRKVVLMSPQERAAMSAKAAAWGQRYSLENLRERVGELLEASWQSPPGRQRQGERLPQWNTNSHVTPTVHK
jgi:glycosyltransferase involved in cell wall biosynthesis